MSCFLSTPVKRCSLTIKSSVARNNGKKITPSRPRTFFAQSRWSSSHGQKEPPRNWPLTVSVMTVPIMFFAWAASDSIFGNRQIGTNEALRQEFLSDMLARQRDETRPILSYCVVRRTSGFTHCLTSVQLGDVVEVLQEGIGPKRAFNLCRLPAHPDEPLSTDIYGWFPTRWLQKLDDYDKMVYEQLKKLEEVEETS